MKGTSDVKIYYWVTDAQNVFYWFKSGSTRRNVQELLVMIGELSSLQLVAKNNLKCDVFASCTNNRLRNFCSKVASPNSAGINAFAQSLDSDFNFCITLHM